LALFSGQSCQFWYIGHILALFSGQPYQFEHLGHIKAHFCGQEGLSLLTDLVGSVDGLLLAVGLKPKVWQNYHKSAD
jgi:hypothetical protein